jgi:hypothetical protein
MLKKLSAFAIVVALMTLTPSMTTAAPPPDRCPKLHQAAGALELALHDMETARHDFCGHKVEAMEATRHALQQIRLAEACDRCR